MTTQTNSNRFRLSILSAAILALSACGGGSSSSTPTPTPTPSPTPAPTPAPAPDWWAVDAPDYSSNPDRPSIVISGEPTITLGIGEEYVDAGATANDPQDGDLSAQIETDNQVDTAVAGDYLVRYSVTDSDGLVAFDATRVVRVVENDTAAFTRRELGTTQINWGYLEHLPPSYADNGEQGAPLIIYHHGNGANANFLETSEDALNSIINNLGPMTLMHVERWDRSLPFVVLAPQMGIVEGMVPSNHIDNFVQYALETYNVDPTRVYMMGWSQGGFLTLDYAIHFPEKLAAAVSMAGGGAPNADGAPENVCDIDEVPMWLFHGKGDSIVSMDASLEMYNYVVNECQPTVAPKLTLMETDRHDIHHFIADLSAMENGRIEGFDGDPDYDLFDQDLYQWLLSYTNER